MYVTISELLIKCNVNINCNYSNLEIINTNVKQIKRWSSSILFHFIHNLTLSCSTIHYIQTIHATPFNKKIVTFNMAEHENIMVNHYTKYEINILINLTLQHLKRPYSNIKWDIGIYCFRYMYINANSICRSFYVWRFVSIINVLISQIT